MPIRDSRPKDRREELPENGRMGGFGNDEWYTPPHIIESARRAMGGIDLDPASCDAAQAIVQAGTYYTKEQNGLRQPWSGRVWLNPPYSADLAYGFSMRIALQYLQGRITCGILLVNNATDTTWFQFLLERFPVVFTKGRIAFWGAGGEAMIGARQGQAIFNIGVPDHDFIREFRGYGAYVKPAYGGNK